MSSTKHPRVKKDKSLRKDHRVFTLEGNKTFRGVWKKKKRRLGKKERRAAEQVLKTVDPVAADDAPSPKRQVPRRLRKAGVVSLERALEIRRTKSPQRFSMFSYASHRYEKV